MELLDVLDENGRPTGKVEDRKIIHEKGLWHYHVGIWIINKQGEILFQKRTHNKKRNPDKWARTGGHVAAGESPFEGIIRETNEELGIKLNKKDISLLGIEKHIIDNKDGIINRTYNYIFLAIVDYKISEYVLQKEEVSEVKYMTLEEMIKEKENKNKDYTFYNWDEENFTRHVEWIKEGMKKI